MSTRVGKYIHATSYFGPFYAMAKNGMAKIVYATSVIKWPNFLASFHRLTCGKRMFHVFEIVYVLAS